MGEQEEKEINKKKGFIILLSGFSGSGKSTLANLLIEYFKKNYGKELFHLEGDSVRSFFDDALGFSQDARFEQGKRLCFGANLLSEAGKDVIMTCTMGEEKYREYMKNKINFYEIFLDADIKDCIKNDPKGVYKKNLNLPKPNLRGIDLPFTPPKNPSLVIYPYKESPVQSAKKIIDFLKQKKLF